MWRLVLAAVCLVSASLAADVSGGYKCPQNGIFPVSGSCNSYYVCIDGTPFVEFCPFSLIFDPIALICNYPDVLNVTMCSAKEFFNFDGKSSAQSERRNPTLPAPPAPRESDLDRYYYSYPYYYSYYYYYPYYTYWYYYWRSNPEARNFENSPLKKSPEMPKATNSFEEEANRIYYSYYYPYYYYYYYPYYYTYYWRNAEVDERSPDAAMPLSLPEPARRHSDASENKAQEGSDRYYYYGYYYPYYYSSWYYPYYYSYWRSANPEQVRDDPYYITECHEDRDGQEAGRKPKPSSKSGTGYRYYYGSYYPYYYTYWTYPNYYWRDSAIEKTQGMGTPHSPVPNRRFQAKSDAVPKDVIDRISSQAPPLPPAYPLRSVDESTKRRNYDYYYYDEYDLYLYRVPFQDRRENYDTHRLFYSDYYYDGSYYGGYYDNYYYYRAPLESYRGPLPRFGARFSGPERYGSFRSYPRYYTYYPTSTYWYFWRSNGVQVPDSLPAEGNEAWYVNYNWDNTLTSSSETGSYTSFGGTSECRRKYGDCSSYYYDCMPNGQPRLLTCPLYLVYNSFTGSCGPRDEVPECRKV